MLYSVVVEQQLNEQTRHQIAQKLGLMLRVTATQIDQQLQRGPLTVNADLTLPEAKEAQARFVRQGIPAHVLDEMQQWVETDAQPSAVAPSSRSAGAPAVASVNLFDEEIQEALGTLDFEQMMAQLAGEPGASTPAPTVQASVGPSLHQQPSHQQPAPQYSAPVSTTPPPERVAPEPSGWGAILGTPANEALPDATPPMVEAIPQVQTPQVPTPQTSASQMSTAQTAPQAGWGALGFGGDAPLEPESTVKPVMPVVPMPGSQASARPASMSALPELGFGAEHVSEAEVVVPNVPEVVGAVPVQPAAAESIAQKRTFDANQLEKAFIEKPKASAAPYAPNPGEYSDRPPHSVEIATMLAVVAPGSAQIYNGQSEKVWHFGTWFFLILPWVNGVKDARAQAQKIHAHHAPMPKDGSLASALKYTAIWYVVVIFIAVFFGVSISKLIKNLNKKPVMEQHSPFLVNSAIEGAYTVIDRASRAGQKASAEAEQESVEDKMSPEERAQRLFLISLPSCEIRNLAVCKASMERVTQIYPRHPHAFKIQVWASLQLKGAKPSPMPEIGKVGSLDTYDAKISAKQDMSADATPATSPGAKDMGAAKDMSGKDASKDASTPSTTDASKDSPGKAGATP